MKRNIMKTLALAIAMMLLLGCLFACDSGETQPSPDDKPATTTKTPSPADDAQDDEEEDSGSDSAALDDIPREETLYFAGLQWGPINGWNPVSSDMNNAVPIAVAAGGSRLPMFETLYMYNMLDGGMYPLLADGDYQWNADMTEMTVKLAQPKWVIAPMQLGRSVFHEFGIKYNTNHGLAMGPYIDTIEA